MNRTSHTTPSTTLKPWRQPWMLPQTSWACCSTQTRLNLAAQAFEPVSLEEMDGVALLDRVDTKFVLTSRQLLEMLPALQQDYWMLEVNGRRLNRYRTLYFDTPNFELYHAHINERVERYKVRSREYVDLHLSFLEVKHHTRKDRTIKSRMLTETQVVQMGAETNRWLSEAAPLDAGALQARLWNTFTRMTLVSKACCERVTLDFNLAFSSDRRLVRLDGLVVAEVKVEVGSQASSFTRVMRSRRLRPQGFSKYAVGVAMLYDGVKKNTIKPKLLLVDQMMKKIVGDE